MALHLLLRKDRCHSSANVLALTRHRDPLRQRLNFPNVGIGQPGGNSNGVNRGGQWGLGRIWHYFGQFRRFERKDRCRQAVITKKGPQFGCGATQPVKDRLARGPNVYRPRTLAQASVHRTGPMESFLHIGRRVRRRSGHWLRGLGDSLSADASAAPAAAFLAEERGVG